jgi:hypothetical protein
MVFIAAPGRFYLIPLSFLAGCQDLTTAEKRFAFGAAIPSTFNL